MIIKTLARFTPLRIIIHRRRRFVRETRRDKNPIHLSGYNNIHGLKTICLITRATDRKKMFFGKSETRRFTVETFAKPSANFRLNNKGHHSYDSADWIAFNVIRIVTIYKRCAIIYSLDTAVVKFGQTTRPIQFAAERRSFSYRQVNNIT